MAKQIDRREFIQHSAFTAAGAAAIAAGTLVPPKAQGDTSNILNYNENMEYRRLGSTDLMISAVCMGGHFGEIPDEADVEKNAEP